MKPNPTINAEGLPEFKTPPICPNCPNQIDSRAQLRSKHLQVIEIADEKHPFRFESGKKLDRVHIAFEIFGKINAMRSNVILICHAFTGDSHVGHHPDEENLLGWWDDFVGPGKPFDTNQYAIICSNVLGGCMGTTGPSCINPVTNTSYALDFPIVTIKDMVKAQKRLLDLLEIPFLLSVIGGSMGGMQTLEWIITYPEFVKSAIPIATTSRLSPQSIAFNEVGRRAIMNDPLWNLGKYSVQNPPLTGLKLARMIGHITYLSDESMRNKFGRDLQNQDVFQYNFEVEFQVESYLNYQGEKFTQRFDANSYLYLTKAQDYFDLSAKFETLPNAFKSVLARTLVIAFESDWLYPIYQSKEIVQGLQQAGKEVSYIEVKSNYGHDAFLLEYDKMAPVLAGFLASIYRKIS